MIRIGFVLLSNSQHPIPSTRIAVLNMFPYLRAAGFDPQIVFEPERGTETPQLPAGLDARLIGDGFRIVYFQKVHGPDVENLARTLRSHGIRTVYGVCDLVHETMATLTDATVIVTDYLKSLYSPALWPKIHVVHDGIEHPEIVCDAYSKERGSRRNPLRAVLVTSAELDRLPVLKTLPSWLNVSVVGRYPPAGQRLRRIREAHWTFDRQHGWQARIAYLRFLANPGIHRIAWDPVDVYEQLRRADIGIIPIDTTENAEPGRLEPMWKVKSENRLTMKMCIGLPVIATPIPSYEPIIEQGRNGFFASSRTEWLECLEALRDPALRRDIGTNARASVINRYSMQEQARLLVDVLRKLVAVPIGHTNYENTQILRSER